MGEASGKTSIQVIERMLDLLDALARNDDPMNLKRLAYSTSLHPSTARRILSMMVECRMVDRVEPGTYRLGIRLLELGNLVKLRINLRQEGAAVHAPPAPGTARDGQPFRAPGR